MKFIKKYKWLLVIIILLVIIGIVLYYLLFMLYNGDSVYGNRLEGADKVVIKEDLKNNIINLFEEEEIINKTQFNIKGKIVNILVQVPADVTVKVAREKVVSLWEDVALKFNKEQLKYYDFQFFITAPDDNEWLPCLGYKNKNSDTIIWSKGN